MRRSVIFTLLLFSLVFSPRKALAVYNPLSVSNNKYGIHIIDENDLENASFLVNSSGGDWGYVTLVIPENERKIDKWQNIFKRLNKLHLIPLVRIATSLKDDFWLKPKNEDVLIWADFL